MPEYHATCRHKKITGILVRQASGTLLVELSEDDQYRLVSTQNLGFYHRARCMLIVEPKPPKELRIETVAPGLRRAVVLPDELTAHPEPPSPGGMPGSMETVLYVPAPSESELVRIFLHGDATVTLTHEAHQAGIVSE